MNVNYVHTNVKHVMMIVISVINVHHQDYLHHNVDVLVEHMTMVVYAHLVTKNVENVIAKGYVVYVQKEE